MSDLGSIVNGLGVAVSMAGFAGTMAFAINASFMHMAAARINGNSEEKFLKKYFGMKRVSSVEIESYKKTKKGHQITSFTYKGQKYQMYSRHYPTTLLADVFNSTRLYTPEQIRRIN